MKIFLISNNSKKIGALELMLTRYGESITVKHFDDFSIKEALEHDLIVLSGGSNLTIHKNRDILANELKLIKESTRPIIGVCLGFELLIDAYHGDLLYDPEKIQGLTQIEARENHPIFKRQKKFFVHESHKYYAREAPSEFIVLANSVHGIEIIMHISRPLFGFQFHPENTNEPNDGYKLFDALITYLQHEKIVV